MKGRTINQQIVIGFGTGRCGTQSLAAFLNQQDGYHVTHEQAGLAWYPAMSDSEACINRFLSTRSGDVIGDIGFYWVNYLDLILRKYPNSKAINIRRPLDDVIESFWSYKNPKEWEGIGLTYWYGYPFDAPTQTKDNIALTVKRYYFLELEVQKIYPESIYVMPMEHLNDKGRLSELLEWIGSERSYTLEQMHLNRRKQLILNRDKAPSIPFEGVLRRKDALS